MRVAYLTAGAGGMLCGSCMRDNTLAAALIRQKRDVLLVPVFTPIRTDEQDVSENRVLYGGINVYLQQKFPFLRKAPRALQRLFDSPALLRGIMKWAGDTSGEDAGRLTAAVLEGEHGPLNEQLDQMIEHLAAYRPDVIHLPDALFVGLARQLKLRLNAAVVCTLTGEDIFLDKLPPHWRMRVLELMRDRARDVDKFISVTRYYGDYSAREFAIDRSRIEHVPLGIQLPSARLQSAAYSLQPFVLGYLARICPEKGLHVLIDAFEHLHAKGRKPRLIIAGYLGRADRPYLEKLRRRWTAAGLSQHIDYRGEVDRAGKHDLLCSIHALSVPTTYREAKGLYVLEALSFGVPVIQPAHGSFPELIEATGGGLLFEPLNPAALAEKISQLMDDPALRERLGASGREKVFAGFSDEKIAERAWQVFESVAVRNSNPSGAKASPGPMEQPIDAATA